MNTGQMRGWHSMQLIHSRIVRRGMKPLHNCSKCGMPIYLLAVNLKSGVATIAYEDAGHGSSEDKVITNHHHASQDRGSCSFVQSGHDLLTGRKLMTKAERTKLEEESVVALEAIDQKPEWLTDAIRNTLVKRILEIGEILTTALMAKE
jgi:hypothetical protein